MPEAYTVWERTRGEGHGKWFFAERVEGDLDEAKDVADDLLTDGADEAEVRDEDGKPVWNSREEVE